MHKRHRGTARICARKRRPGLRIKIPHVRCDEEQIKKSIEWWRRRAVRIRENCYGARRKSTLTERENPRPRKCAPPSIYTWKREMRLSPRISRIRSVHVLYIVRNAWKNFRIKDNIILLLYTPPDV